jgi:hypothetical protein
MPCGSPSQFLLLELDFIDIALFEVEYNNSFFMVWGFMVFKATFNNISVISWRSVLLMEEIRENHRPVASHCQALSHNVVSSTPHHEQGSNLQLQL